MYVYLVMLTDGYYESLHLAEVSLPGSGGSGADGMTAISSDRIILDDSSRNVSNEYYRVIDTAWIFGRTWV